MLGVSRATAQRAMKVLGDSEMLLRRRSLGTFVGPGAFQTKHSKVRTVYVITPEVEHNWAWARWMTRGIQRGSSCTNINFGIVPKNNSIDYLKQLIQSAKAAGSFLGIIATGGNRNIYQYLAESGIPTVIFGSLYQDNTQIPSLDLDNREAARLMTRYLIDRGHRRMMSLTISDGRPGDHAFFDGVSDVLTETGLPANALVMRIVPNDMKSAMPIVRQLLAAGDRPSGLIVRGTGILSAVDHAIEQLKLSLPGEVEVVCQNVNTENEFDRKHTHVMPRQGLENAAERLGHMIKQLAQNNPLEETRVVIPVELHGAAKRAEAISGPAKL